VSKFAEALKGDALLAERVLGGVGMPEDFDEGGVEFDLLLAAGGLAEFAVNAYAGTGMEMPDFGVVVEAVGSHDLEVCEAGTIVHFEKGKTALGVAPSTDPTASSDMAVHGGLV
jgi:hypothetical protein